MTIALQSPSLINDFADFLASAPSRGEILRWRPSAPVERRYLELVELHRDGRLGPEESKEMEAFLNSEILLSQLKARLRHTLIARGRHS
jgi:hypothetical protein